MIKYGKKINKLREIHNITQKKLADILGYSESYVSMIESDNRNVSDNDLFKIADFFNISKNYFSENDTNVNFNFRADNNINGDDFLKKQIIDDFLKYIDNK